MTITDGVGVKVMYLPSTENCVVEIVHKVANVVTDPRVDFPNAKMAFLKNAPKLEKPTDDTSDTAVWFDAAWEAAKNRYFLTCLIGPRNSGVPLAAGKYYVWVFLDGVVEEPIKPAGTLEVK